MKILSIGNSFSQNAQVFLHDVALGEGVDMETVNLMIGGCPLQRHWANAESGEAAYGYERNGKPVLLADGQKRMISLRDALTEENWDVITLQQASHDSGIWETYMPYLPQLSEYVRSLAPNAKQVIHETWAYEIDTIHSQFARYDRSQEKMYAALKAAYANAARTIHAEMIPVGDVMQALRGESAFDYANGGMSLCAPDGFHASKVYGNYAVAVTWYMFLTGNTDMRGGFAPEDSSAALLGLIRGIAKKIVEERR